MEFRIKDCNLQAEDDGSLKVGGYINVTERESEMLYNKKNGKWFKEVMKKGVFKRAISSKVNIPLLFEHNWEKQLASIEEGSLTLKEDNIGLRFDAVIKDENVYQQVRAGIINSCSFGFRALAEEIETINTRLEKRFVSAIELLEVSLVKNPAYVGSLCETRSYEEELQEEQIKEESEEVEIDKDSEERVEETRDVKTEEETETVEESVEEEVETEVVENSEEKDSENSDDVDKRFGESITTVEKVEAELDKAYLREVVEELIDEKMKQINVAEEIEECINQEAEYIKEDFERILEDNNRSSMEQSAEVIRLKIQLLKLKQMKEGI